MDFFSDITNNITISLVKEKLKNIEDKIVDLEKNIIIEDTINKTNITPLKDNE